MPRSTMNAVMPLCFLARSTDAKTRKWSAMSARLIQIFWPLRTYESPSRLAVVARFAASVPTPGSVRPNVASFSPFACGTRKRCFWSSVPHWQQRQRVEADVDAHHHAEGGVGALELLAQDAQADVVEARCRRTPRGSARPGSRARPCARRPRGGPRASRPTRGCAARSPWRGEIANAWIGRAGSRRSARDQSASPVIVAVRQRTVTGTRWTMLLPMPWWFHGWSIGWTSPAASVARQRQDCARPVARPRRRSTTPGKVTDRRAENGVRPRAVDADLHALDRATPRPGTAEELDAPGFDYAVAAEEVRDAGRHHQRTRPDSRDRLARFVAVRRVVVGRRLLVALNGSVTASIEVSHLTLVMPYQPGTIRRSGIAVLRLQRPAVHLVDEHHLGSLAPLRRSGCAGSPARSRPGSPRSAPVKTTSTASSRRPGSLEQRPQRRARSIRPCRSPRTATAGSSAVGCSRARPLPAHSSVTGDASLRGMALSSAKLSSNGASTAPPILSRQESRVDRRNVEMDQQVVQPGRRQVVAQRLERHAAVARGELAALRRSAGRRSARMAWRIGTRHPRPLRGASRQRKNRRHMPAVRMTRIIPRRARPSARRLADEC